MEDILIVAYDNNEPTDYPIITVARNRHGMIAVVKTVAGIAGRNLYKLLTDANSLPVLTKNSDEEKIVRCKECKYAPSATNGHDLDWPYTNVDGFDVNPCPMKCADSWYSRKPEPVFFCAYGETKEEQNR